MFYAVFVSVKVLAGTEIPGGWGGGGGLGREWRGGKAEGDGWGGGEGAGTKISIVINAVFTI